MRPTTTTGSVYMCILATPSALCRSQLFYPSLLASLWPNGAHGDLLCDFLLLSLSWRGPMSYDTTQYRRKVGFTLRGSVQILIRSQLPRLENSSIETTGEIDCMPSFKPQADQWEHRMSLQVLSQRNGHRLITIFDKNSATGI
jgi:hypothetical protein